MANVFKNVMYEVTDTLAVAYTCPASTTAIVIGCQAANKSNTAAVSLTLKVDNGVDDEFLVNDVTIPTDASLAPIAGKLVLEDGHELQAETGATGDVGLVLSILEIS
jgi:hypothetical protein